VEADVFAVLADPTRRRIVEILHRGESSVGELVEAVDIAQPGVSRHLRILGEARDKSVFTLTGKGHVYEFQLRLIVRYQLTKAGREEPVIPPTEIEARRLITYSETAPIAKETEEQFLYKDMQTDLTRQILRHIAAVKREM